MFGYTNVEAKPKGIDQFREVQRHLKLMRNQPQTADDDSSSEPRRPESQSNEKGSETGSHDEGDMDMDLSLDGAELTMEGKRASPSAEQKELTRGMNASAASKELKQYKIQVKTQVTGYQPIETRNYNLQSPTSPSSGLMVKGDQTSPDQGPFRKQQAPLKYIKKQKKQVSKENLYLTGKDSVATQNWAGDAARKD